MEQPPGSQALLGDNPRPNPSFKPEAVRSMISSARGRSGRPVDAEAPAVEEALRSRGGGEPLPDNVRRAMEVRFHADLSRVRIHSDEVAQRASEAINARAFTVGDDLFFAAGAFMPATP